jgi:hypothetical protein
MKLGHCRRWLFEWTTLAVHEAPRRPGKARLELGAHVEGLTVVGLKLADEMVVPSQRRMLCFQPLGFVDQQARARRSRAGPSGEHAVELSQMRQQKTAEQKIGCAWRKRHAGNVMHCEFDRFAMVAPGFGHETVRGIEPHCSAGMEHVADQCRAPARAAPQIDRESNRARAMSFEKLARLGFVELRQPAQALARAIVVAERVAVSAGHTVSLAEAARWYSPGVTPTIRLKCRHR